MSLRGITDPTLSLRKLREANVKRQAIWPGGGKIDLNFRGLELAGEAGELANLLKKLVRIELGIKGTTEDKLNLLSQIEEEIGDVAICIDLIGMQLDKQILPQLTPRFIDPVDPATYASDLCDKGAWLFICVGDLSGSTSYRERDPDAEGMLSAAWNALRDLCYLLKLDVLVCARIKFNMTSRKHGFPVYFGGDDYI